MEYKECFRCKQSLEESKFTKKTRREVVGLSTYCKACDKQVRNGGKRVIVPKLESGLKKCSSCKTIKDTSQFYKSSWGSQGVKGKCKICYSLSVNIKDRSPEENLFWAAKRRASLKGRNFDLCLSDIVIPKFCPLLNIPLKVGDKNSTDNSPTIDRLDNSLGYTKENVWVISHKANWFKGTHTLQEMELIINNLKKKLNEQRD